MKIPYFLIGGKKHGAGHIIRGYEFSKAFSEFDFIFLGRGENIVELGNKLQVSINNYPVDIINFIKEHKFKLLFLDNHGFTKKIIENIKSNTKIVSIDDTSDGIDLCDLVIDAQKLPSNNPKHLFGIKYIIIREKIINIKKYIQKMDYVLIYGGASENINKYLKIILEVTTHFFDKIKIILPSKKIKYNYNKNIEYLYTGECNFEMLLANANLIITSGGIGMYESAFLGTPIIAFPLLLHQKQNIENFILQGGNILYLKNLDNTNEIYDTFKEFKRLSKHKINRMINKNMSLIDGKGMYRIKEKIYELI